MGQCGLCPSDFVRSAHELRGCWVLQTLFVCVGSGHGRPPGAAGAALNEARPHNCSDYGGGLLGVGQTGDFLSNI